MCGINGIYGLNDEFRTRDILVHMNAAIAHRGPDAQGIMTRGRIGLGHRRLSIIDLSESGRQPMVDSSGFIFISFNGEIYNFQKLKQECKGYEFKTGTDTEVILALYQKYGEKCFEKLDGMFALAIWDDNAKKLVLARDRMGKKPIYYFWDKSVLVFSSEIRGLLASGLIKPRISEDGLENYLQYQTVYSPETILENIHMVPASSYVVIQNGITDTYKFWNLDRAKEKYSLTGPYDKVVKQTRELFFTAVEKRMISDVPLGAFLSGGVDSSAVVAAMAQVSNSKVKTFNVYFDEAEFSESKYAEMVAAKFKTDHHAIQLKADDFLNEIPAGLNAMDHPSVDGLNTYIVSKYTRNAGITVALSGLGGDEMFGGYPVFKYIKQWYKYRAVRRIPHGMRKVMLKMLQKRVSETQAQRLAQLAEIKSWNWTEIYPVFRMVFTNAEMIAAGLTPFEIKDIEGDNNSGFRLLSEISIAESKTYMENVLLRDADQMSMAHSLEVRVPFLDRDLMEFVLSLPDDFKPIQPGKKLIIDAMGDLLPREVWDRPKMGFTFPWKHWVNNELRTFCEENLEYIKNAGILPPGFVDNRVLTLQTPENKEWYKVWNLVVLGYWMRRNKVNFD